MSTKNVNSEEFFEEISSGDAVIVDFWADWCAPCKALSPILEKLSDKYPNIKVLKVDIMANRELATENGVKSIPFLAAFKDGKIVASKTGYSGPHPVEELFLKLTEK